jgi:hypothetical protein
MKGVTKIDDLNFTSTSNMINHETKNLFVTMIDSIKKCELTTSPDERCWWCRATFTTRAIGCPLRYTSRTIVKTFTSDVSKEHFVLEQPIPIDEKADESDVTILPAYYETDGIFCSFNCCRAFIEQELCNSKTRHYYKESMYLLMKMYADFHGTYPNKLKPAPSWRLLKEYGGYMTIEEFRNGFNINCYTEKGYIGDLPQIKTIGTLFEETYLF